MTAPPFGNQHTRQITRTPLIAQEMENTLFDAFVDLLVAYEVKKTENIVGEG